MDDLSNIFDEAERYLHSSLRRWRKQLPEMYEDAFQEGMIQVWRDVEAGETIKLKILRRASMCANKFMHRNGEYFFGKPQKSREGISKNTTTLEKVQVFLEEYLPVHNGVYPTTQVISEATGLHRSAAANALKKIREGRIDHMKYRPDGRMDWNYYTTMSVERLAGSENEDKRHWTENNQVRDLADTWEDGLVSNLDLTKILNQLNEGHRETLYLYLYEGYSPTEIARMAGKEQNPNSKGSRTLKAALNQVRMILDPYQGECSKGHVRTPETSVVKRRYDGYLMHFCTVCRKESGGDQTPKVTEGKKMGRPAKKICPKGHTKDKIDSHGRLRCSKCRAEAQRRYTAKNRKNDESSS